MCTDEFENVYNCFKNTKSNIILLRGSITPTS